MAEPTYRDFDFAFKSHPLSQDIVTVTDGNAIKTSLKNLVRLIRYDKPFNPEISSPLYDALFEPIDPATASLMKTGLTFLIEDYEPRIENLKIVVTPIPKENKYTIDMAFTVKKSNSRETLQLFLPVERLK